MGRLGQLYTTESALHNNFVKDELTLNMLAQLLNRGYGRLGWRKAIFR